MARFFSFLVLATLCVLACCGRIEPHEGTDSGSPAGSPDGGADADVDGSFADCTGSCPSTTEGTCRPSATSICGCDHSTERWWCRPCLTEWSQPGTPPTVLCANSPCPAALAGVGRNYPNGCGSFDQVVCFTDGWSAAFGGCYPDCPITEPIRGSACTKENAYCETASACGTRLELDCLEGRWSVFQKSLDCTHVECATAPNVGDPCNGDSECEPKNACGGRDRAICVGGFWTLEKGSCCPATLPAEGAACTDPARVACHYDAPETDCYCEPDHTFHCMRPPPSCVDGAACDPGYTCQPTQEIFCSCKAGTIACDYRYMP